MDSEVGVQCGHCGGNVFMATCDKFRGSGHEWVMVSLCMICRAVHWIEGGCPQCNGGDGRMCEVTDSGAETTHCQSCGKRTMVTRFGLRWLCFECREALDG